MRISLSLCLLAFIAMTSAPRAETTILTGAYGPADIARACQSAGGTPTGVAGSSYGCKKENCDGKGGTCSVECVDPLKCKAETPGRIVVPTTLLGLLQNGSMVYRGGVSVNPGSTIENSGESQTSAPSPVFVE